MVAYHQLMASWSGKLITFNIGGPTDELHSFIRSSETGLGLVTVLAALFSKIRQISKATILLFFDSTY